MKIRYLLAAILAICAAYFFFTYLNNTNSTPTVTKSSVIQLVPFPAVISNAEGRKDNCLQNLLINKTPDPITITNAEIPDIDAVLKFPFDMKGLSMRFTYDQSLNRINFEGYNSDVRQIKISGHYELTNKNSIKYLAHIHDSSNTLEIEALYNPGDSGGQLSDGAADGKFTFKSNVMESYEVALEGNFTYKSNKLTIPDMHITSQDMDVNVKIDLEENDKVTLNAVVHHLHLKELLNKVDLYKFFNMYDINAIFRSNIDLIINATAIKYNDIQLGSFILKAKSDSADKTLQVENIQFSSQDDLQFSGKGILSRNQFRPQYKGDISIKNLSSTHLSNLFNLPSHNDDKVSKVSINSAVTITPSLILLNDFELTEGNALFTSPAIKYSFYDDGTSLFKANLKILQFSEKSEVIKNILGQNNLFFKLLQPDYSHAQALQHYKNSKMVTDVGLVFENASYENKKIEQISLQYSHTPESFELRDITFNDPQFKLQGNVAVHLNADRPNLNIELSGDKVDMTLFNHMIGSKFFSYGNDHQFSIFRFNEFDGRIKLDLSNGDIAPFVNCTALLDKGNLNVRECKLGMFGGKAVINEGILKLDKGLSCKAQYTIEGAELEQLAPLIAPIKSKGRVNLTCDEWSSHGNSIKEMLLSADAKLKLKAVTEVSVNDLNISNLINKYRKAPKANTIFKDLEGNFKFDGGTLKIDKLYFVTDKKIHGQTSCAYNLSSEAINGDLRLVYLTGVADKTEELKILYKGPKLSQIKTEKKRG